MTTNGNKYCGYVSNYYELPDWFEVVKTVSYLARNWISRAILNKKFIEWDCLDSGNLFIEIIHLNLNGFKVQKQITM